MVNEGQYRASDQLVTFLNDHCDLMPFAVLVYGSVYELSCGTCGNVEFSDFL